MSALLGTDTLHHKSQKAGHLSANLIGEYRAIFAACDTDGNGTLDAEEVKGALSRAGQKCSDAEVQSLIGEVDKNGDGVVDFAEFVRLLAIHDEASHEHQDKVQALATLGEGKLRRQSTRVLSADQVAHYSDLFDSFDIDGNGGIDVQELFHGLRGHRGGVTLADCRRYMAKVPQDDDGCIALPEFLQIIAMQEIVKGGVGNLIVEQTKASLNTQKYLSHAKVLEVEALFARADDDKNGLLEHHELLDALNENARGKKPSKFLNELRFAFATSDRRGPRGTQIFNPTSMCA
ncbi:Ca2-binding protein [Aureococcus anophagefferens]|nr:Ca2-binding protein [Aureococcus anophagefferens]